jgi:hypothetical protein
MSLGQSPGGVALDVTGHGKLPMGHPDARVVAGDVHCDVPRDVAGGQLTAAHRVGQQAVDTGEC